MRRTQNAITELLVVLATVVKSHTRHLQSRGRGVIVGSSNGRMCISLALVLASCGYGPGFTDEDCYPLEMRASDTICTTAYVDWEISNSSFQHDHKVAELPWSKTLVFCEGDVAVQARRQCDDNGIITVEIWFNDTLEESGTAEGPTAQASAACWVD